MARTGMTDIIETVRGLTDAGTADYTIGTTTYWSADAVQTVCDRHRDDFKFIEAQPVESYAGGGTVQYLEYHIGRQNLESGTLLVIEDSVGDDYGTTLYTVDYARGVITFGTDTTGSAVYVTGRSYDINGAAADIWKMKAANSAKYFDFSTDNHSIKRSQFMQHCMTMAEFYANEKEPNVVMVYREDNRL